DDRVVPRDLQIWNLVLKGREDSSVPSVLDADFLVDQHLLHLAAGSEPYLDFRLDLLQLVDGLRDVNRIQLVFADSVGQQSEQERGVGRHSVHGAGTRVALDVPELLRVGGALRNDRRVARDHIGGGAIAADEGAGNADRIDVRIDRVDQVF